VGTANVYLMNSIPMQTHTLYNAAQSICRYPDCIAVLTALFVWSLLRVEDAPNHVPNAIRAKGTKNFLLVMALLLSG